MRQDMIKILSEASLALFATSSLASPVIAQAGGDANIYGWISRFGALALCAFMVLQNYRQSDSLSKIIGKKDELVEKKDTQILALSQALMEAMQENTNALSAMTDSLNQRPCIMPNPLEQGDPR